ncbi:hypothetical protein ACFYWX_43725 [Streptomyces sp. NPDC002888]|uniref:hypothetical protein n=1 Tax=Streptomyces sp. NPDC002888 TaxID=3364668 RepID=UPI0036998260
MKQWSVHEAAPAGQVDHQPLRQQRRDHCFVRHANNNCHVTGLPQIPEQKLAPHMFRCTMAMLTREFPGSEIAVGMQLNNVATRALANTTTQGYTEPSPAWAQHLMALSVSAGSDGTCSQNRAEFSASRPRAAGGAPIGRWRR